MLQVTQNPLPAELSKLSAAIQTLSQRSYISRAPNIALLLARGLVWIASRLVGIRTYPGPYPAYDKKFLEHRSATLRGQAKPEDALPFSPYVGPYNPISPRFRFVIEEAGQRASATIVAPATFAGPPDTVHGGMVAGIFDDLLGTVNWSGANSGFTGTLTVRYHRHTPILKPVQLEAECTKREGRKTWVQGKISFNGEVTATAEAIFIQPKRYSAQTK